MPDIRDRDLWLGIDLGTQGVRALAVPGDGRVRGLAVCGTSGTVLLTEARWGHGARKP